MVPAASLQSDTAPRQELPLTPQVVLELIQVLPPKPAAVVPTTTDTEEVDVQQTTAAASGEQAASKSKPQAPPVFSVQSPNKPAGPGADTPVTGSGNGDLWQGPVGGGSK